MNPSSREEYAQLAIRDALIRQGVDPARAEAEARSRVMAAAEEMAAVTYGNGADVDNLAAADTPFEMDSGVGRPAVPQSERVFRDDNTGGMAAQVAAREAAANASWEERGRYYGPKEAALAETYGPAGAANADVTESQLNARLRRREAEEVQRHSGFEEERRIARMAERAGIPISQAKELVQQGYNQSAADRGIPSPAAWQVSGQNRTVPPDFDHFSDSYAGLREAVAEKRSADKAARKAEVSKRAMLAQNPMGYIGRDDITEEQRAIVTDRLQGRRKSVDDPRIRVAEIQAKSATDAATAERESRVSQQQWLETTRIAAEERAAARAEANAVAQRQFDSEQKALDREARMAEGDAVREEAAAQRQADLDERQRQHAETMQRLESQDAANQRRHEEAQLATQQQFDRSTQQFEARYGLDERKIEAEKQAAADAMQRAEREQLLRSMESSYTPGVRNIAAGDYESPEAQEALRQMAAASDQTWLGFWEADGRRMDGILERLGVNDPVQRRQLVERFGYGLENDFFGAGGDGRGGALSYWLAGRPK